MRTDFLASTTFDVPGHTVERTMGLAWGVIVRSVGVMRGLTGGLKAIRQGEVTEFTAVVNAARQTAFERLVQDAEKLGGNAVIGVRFDSSDIGNGLSEIVAYGTAARVTPV